MNTKDKHRMESEEIRVIHCFYLITSLWSLLQVYIGLNIEWEGNYEYCIWKAEELLACELD